MKTLTTSIILSVMFLSAGAFAGSRNDAHIVTAPAANPANVTVITKNAAWPPAMWPAKKRWSACAACWVMPRPTWP